MLKRQRHKHQALICVLVRIAGSDVLDGADAPSGECFLLVLLHANLECVTSVHFLKTEKVLAF